MKAFLWDKIPVMILLLQVLITPVYSQNILINGDFETFSTLPTTQGQIVNATPWQNVVLSSDYMNTTYAGWTPNIGGAYSGTGFAGFATYGNSNGSAEAIGQSISGNPLLPNVQYNIKAYAKMTSAPAGGFGNYTDICGGLTLYGFTSQPVIGTAGIHTNSLPGATLLWNSDSVYSTAWNLFEGCFQSPATINYLVVTLENIPGCRQYVFVDSLSLTTSNLVVDLGPDTTLCTGDSILLDMSASNGTYIWQDGSSQPTFNVTQAGTYWVQVSNDCGTDTDTITVSFAAPPTVSLGNDTTICQGQSLLLDVTTTGATYLWQDGSNTPIFIVSQTGIYWVQLTTGGCTASDSLLVLVVDPPLVLFGSDTTLCQGQILNLTMNASGGSYLWNNGNTTSAIQVTQSGTYWGQSINQCGTSVDTIVVDFTLPPVADLGSDTTLCQGGQVVLDVTGNGYTYTWQDNSTSSSITVTQSGVYWVSVSNDCGTVSDTVQITFDQIPVVSLGADTTLCDGDDLLLDVSGTGSSYTWNDGSSASQFLVQQQGTYWVTVTSGTCTGGDTINVTYNAIPNVDLGSDTLLCDGDIITLSAGVPGGSYIWNDNSDSSFLSVSQSGIYFVEVFLGNCSARDTVVIDYEDCEVVLVLPNIFTPNDDGFNDMFVPIESKGVASLEAFIFNRWGQELYSTQLLNIEWNGESKSGGSSPDGTYYYLVKYRDKKGNLYEQKGAFRLNR